VSSGIEDRVTRIAMAQTHYAGWSLSGKNAPMPLGVTFETDRLQRLQGLTDAALAHLHLDDLLEALLLRTRELLGVDTCAVLLLDEERAELVARAAVGIEEEVAAGVRIPVGRGFAGQVAAGKQPVILDDVDHADVLNPILREKGIKSMLGVPLLVAGRVTGVMHVGTLVHHRFTAADVELLQFAADRAAIAIEHAVLYEAEHRARERIENVQAVTDAALAHLEVEELLTVLLPRIRDILRTDTCAVLLLDKPTNELVARAALGIEEEVEQGVRIPVGGGFAGRVAASKQPVILDDLAMAHVLNPILREKGITSMLGVPLLISAEAIGVLHVGTLQHRTFTEEDVELLQLVAQRVAIAIERAQLHEETLLLDQLKLNFVAIASHELRTPAAAIYGALATITQRADLSEEIEQTLIVTAYEQSDRLRRLIEQLLDLSRLDDRATSVSPRPIVLHSVLRDIAASVVPGEPVELEVPADLVSVADPLVLERVISNLLTNAVRHGEPPVRVGAAQEPGRLRISVEDAGRGVPEELRPRLFERFSRSDSTVGNGLGLAIARAYARSHGGDLLYAESERGARFELILPQD
jgi:signal transduction histidine kinase